MLMALWGVHGLSLKLCFPCNAREREENSLKDISKTSTDSLFYRRYVGVEIVEQMAEHKLPVHVITSGIFFYPCPAADDGGF